MERILEPELMLAEGQALAYARADFEEPHQRVLEEFQNVFAGDALDGHLLDLGCGPGDITFRFARAYPRARLVGIDGSPAMLTLARERAQSEGALKERVSFIEGIIPEAPIPTLPYQAIISNSLLHHLHRPEVLWETVQRCAEAGTRLFIYDLRRPATPAKARELVDLYSAGEPEILQSDFYHSLLAAFMVGEVEAQLVRAGLANLTVRPIGDRHLVVHGIM
jgi:ubiquinone/menaquinone biosynthesis C-methylase UbiE